MTASPSASLDRCMRYVLPADSVLVRNLAALWAVDPELAEALEALEGRDLYAVEPSKDGAPTVAVRTAEGRSIYLHSRYRPVEEAEKLVASASVEGKLLICVHGLGLGYHLESAVARASEEAIFAVFEPDLLLLRTALEQRDLSGVIGSRRVLFFTRAEKAELYERLTPHSAMLTVGFASISHAPSMQVAPEFHRQFQGWIAEFLAYCRTNLNTAVLNGRRTAENVARNLKWYAGNAGIGHLAGRHQGEPGIIVSAGPSLRKNKHLLKDAQGRAVIIAVQTTLQPLLEMSVEPHYVTSLDYHDICTRFFERLPDTLRTELVAEPKASSAIFSLYPGPVSLLGNEFADTLLAGMGGERKARLRAGATVAHLAYYLAEHLGCDPIIFIGQDLGFSDGLCYTPGTSYEDVWRPELSRFCTMEMKQWEHIVRERPILRRIPDYQGRPMYTEERLFAYLQQFERDFAGTRTRIIDATEGGAAKQGAATMPLAEAVERYCRGKVARPGGQHVGQDWAWLTEAAACIARRGNEAQRIERISRETLPLLEEIRDHIADQGRVNRLIARVDALRAQMQELGGCFDLVMQLTQETELRRFRNDRRIAAEKLSGLELQKRQIERDIGNVRGVVEAAVEFQRLMEEVAADLRSTAMEREGAA